EPDAMRTAATAEDVADILAAVPEAAALQGEAARRIVLSRHTGLVRAGELAAALQAADRPNFLHVSTNLERPAVLRHHRRAEKGTSLVAGGAGFLGSHLVDHLLGEGRAVVCVDSFLTGLPQNVMRHEGNANLQVLQQDILQPL